MGKGSLEENPFCEYNVPTMTEVTFESRDALPRARFFLTLAEKCPGEDRVEFESFLEAAIVFGRTALHRFKTKHEAHPAWKRWWESLAGDVAVRFVREHRDWILKEGPTKVGQKVWLSGVVGNMSGADVKAAKAYEPQRAGEFYYYENASIPATATVGKCLSALEALLEKAEKQVFI
jgi:hypothetical protein